ncbi:hypothetical protein ACFX15_008990 [Malus domestica]
MAWALVCCYEVARAWACYCMAACSPQVEGLPWAAMVVPHGGDSAPLAIVLSLVDRCDGAMPRSPSFSPNP